MSSDCALIYVNYTYDSGGSPNRHLIIIQFLKILYVVEKVVKYKFTPFEKVNVNCLKLIFDRKKKTSFLYDSKKRYS